MFKRAKNEGLNNSRYILQFLKALSIIIKINKFLNKNLN